MTKKERPSLEELKEELQKQGILYQESPAWTTYNGALIVSGETAIVTVREGATPDEKRKTIERTLRPRIIEKARKEGQVLFRKRERRQTMPNNITSLAEWRGRKKQSSQ